MNVNVYLGPLILAVLVILYVTWCFSRARSLLHRWGVANGFEILHFERRIFFAGPFTWTSSRNQFVYFVRVRDREGRERSGWVRCGGLLAGVFSEETEVRWKDD